MLNNRNLMHFNFTNLPRAAAAANYMASTVGDLGYVIHIANMGGNKMYYVFPPNTPSKDSKLSIMRFELHVTDTVPCIKFDLTQPPKPPANILKAVDFYMMATTAAIRFQGVEVTDYRRYLLTPKPDVWSY